MINKPKTFFLELIKMSNIPSQYSWEYRHETEPKIKMHFLSNSNIMLVYLRRLHS